MKAVNLLPDARPRGDASSAGGPSGPRRRLSLPGTGEPNGAPSSPLGFAILGVLALALVGVFFFLSARNDVTEGKAQIVQVEAQAAAAQARAAALKPYADFASMAEQRTQTIQSLASSRFDWEQVLRDLSRAIPQRVTLTKIAGSVRPGSGGGASKLRAALPVPAVELVGCTRNHDDTARMLSALRGVQGVTRVSLEGSDKEKSVGDGSTGGTACGEDTPAFVLVAFFENDDLGAAAGALGAATGPTGPSGPTGAAAQPASAATPAAAAQSTSNPGGTP